MTVFQTLGVFGAITALLASPATAHTWIEQMRVISDNGSFTGDSGYPRGYMARTDPGFTGFSDNYMVPATGIRITPNDSLCHPAQRTSNYTNPSYPKLKVAPGQYVAMQYLENGHTTLPHNQIGKPKNGGTVFVYGTTQPSNDEKMADVLAWTKDGSGGNKKGFLMTAQSFDDGVCHQINCGNISVSRQQNYPVHPVGQPTVSLERWCETDVQIPSSVKPGQLTVYWVWQWPTEPGEDCFAPEGKDEYYTTCSDFTITNNNNGGGLKNKAIAIQPDKHTLVQQNPQNLANPNWQSRTALTASPKIIMVEGTKTLGLKIAAASASSFMSACQASQKANAGKPPAAPPAEAPCAPVTKFLSKDATPTTAPTSSVNNNQALENTPQPAQPTQSTQSAGETEIVTVTQMVTVTTLLPSGQPIPDSKTQPVSISTTSTASEDQQPTYMPSSRTGVVIPTLSILGDAPAPSTTSGSGQVQVPVSGGPAFVERRHARQMH